MMSRPQKTYLAYIFMCANVFLFMAASAIAQTGQEAYYNSVTIPPAPGPDAVSSFVRNPVNYNTGTVDISVPIYNLKGKRISIPIGIRYNSSGVKVDDKSGFVGLGWSLMAGGVISRSVRGLPDETPSHGFMYAGKDVPSSSTLYKQGTITAQAPQTYEYVGHISNGQYDYEPDAFSISSPSVSAEFVFDNSGSIQTSPAQDLQIEPIYGSTNDFPTAIGGNRSENVINGWRVIDQNGLIYIFGGDLAYLDFTQYRGEGPDDMPFISSWHLKEIIDPFSSEVATFSYASLGTDYRYINVPSQSIDYKLVGANYNSANGVQIQTTTVDVIDMKFLSAIELNDIRVEFVNGSSSGQYPVYSVIKVLGQDVTKFKREFGLTYELKGDGSPQTKRILLKKLIESLENNEKKEYRFYYNEQISMPPYGSTAQDYWGYYNGKTNNQNHIPNENFGNGNLGFANKAPSEEHAKALILTKIEYPTGGSSQYDYEINSYQKVNAEESFINKKALVNTTGTGLKDMVCVDQLAAAQGAYIHTFELFYEVAADETHPNYDPFHNQVEFSVFDDQSGALLYNFFEDSDIIKTIKLLLREGNDVGYRLEACVNGAAIRGYAELRYKQNSTLVDSYEVPSGGLRIIGQQLCPEQGKCIEYTYDYNESGYLVGGLPKYYIEYEVLNEAPGHGDYEKHITLYSSNRASLASNPIAYTFVTEYMKDEAGNKVNVVERYYPKAFDVGGSGAPFVPKISYTHYRGQLIKQKDYLGASNVKVLQNETLFTYQSVYPRSYVKGIKATKVKHPSQTYNSNQLSDFLIEEYFIMNGFSRILKEESIQYSNNQQFKTTKDYVYTDKNIFSPSEIIQKDSKGGTRTTKYSYPRDLVNCSGGCEQNLKQDLKVCKEDNYTCFKELETCQSIYNNCYGAFQQCQSDLDAVIQDRCHYLGTLHLGCLGRKAKDANCHGDLNNCISNSNYLSCVNSSSCGNMACFVNAYNTYNSCVRADKNCLYTTFTNTSLDEQVRTASLFLMLNINSVPIKEERYVNGAFMDGSRLGLTLNTSPTSANPENVNDFTKPLVSGQYYITNNQTEIGKGEIIASEHASSNPTVVKGSDGQYAKYIWNPDNANQLLAYTSGETQETGSIAFTGFEEGQQGGWAYGVGGSSDYSRTGNKGYNSTSSISTTVDVAGKYTISCWARRLNASGTNNNLRLNNNALNHDKTVLNTNWSLFQWTIDVPSGSRAVTVSLGSNVVIDDLRLHLSHVNMSSYTYQSGLGVTSSTDPNQITSFYEYDKAGRLKLQKDAAGDILAKSDYGYTQKSSGEYTLSTASLDFGQVVVNTQVQKTFTISNPSTTTVNIQSITYPTDFTGNVASATILAGASKTVTVTYQPTEIADERNETINIVSDGYGPQAVDVIGQGIATPTRIISLSGSLAFSEVKTNTTKSLNVTVNNLGTAPLIITSVSLPSRYSADWTTATIEPGDSRILVVTFAPIAYTDYNGQLSITSNKTSGTSTLPVTGKGVKTVIIDPDLMETEQE